MNVKSKQCYKELNKFWSCYILTLSGEKELKSKRVFKIVENNSNFEWNIEQKFWCENTICKGPILIYNIWILIQFFCFNTLFNTTLWHISEIKKLVYQLESCARVAIWPFLKLFARNKMVWPCGHFLAFFECWQK